MEVKLVHVTPEAEKHIAYCARVSSSNQSNPEYAKLLKYCITHGHYSVFEMASMCVEITTSRAIAAQILRHKSFAFQEFSLRYAEATNFELYEARSQDMKNRQNSIDNLPEETKQWFVDAQTQNNESCYELYQEALNRNIAKEQARMLLPLSTQTKLYMHGTIRSWIHYIQLREKNGTQKEHAEIALAIKKIFEEQLPVVAEVLK
jgi:thymidylate synthase (FAD)